jgi:hypothetical protein
VGSVKSLNNLVKIVKYRCRSLEEYEQNVSQNQQRVGQDSGYDACLNLFQSFILGQTWLASSVLSFIGL